MQPRDAASLTDILEAARLACSFVADIDQEVFDDNVMIQSAVIRQIEIIGEAVKRLSDNVREDNPHIPWRNMAGMRDILIHAYDHVDPDEVWNVVKYSLPELIVKLDKLLPEQVGRK
jgi:uncharacterized protein with HEPN domain